MRPSERARAGGALLVLAALSAGCVHQGDPGVAITKLEASLVFGVKPPAPSAKVTPVASATPPVDSGSGAGPVEQAAVPADSTGALAAPSTAPFQPFSIPKGAPGLSETVSDCPSAPPTAQAEKAAQINVDSVPPVGLYRFKRDLSTKDAAGATKKRSDFVRRVVTNAKKVSDGVYTFDVVAPRSDKAGVSVSSYQVKTNATQSQPSANLVVVGPRVGDPERGLALKRIEFKNAGGGTDEVFSPNTGLLLLPLPVQQGESYRSAAVDPKTGRTMAVDANVVRRARIDACGKLVDGWQVTTSFNDSVDPSTTVAYRYDVATQYGAILVNEQFDTPADTPTSTVAFTLGQLTPDPVPAGF